MKLPTESSGKNDNLPLGGTTMWFEPEYECPHDNSHSITGSTLRIYCSECGIYWNRDYIDIVENNR